MGLAKAETSMRATNRRQSIARGMSRRQSTARRGEQSNSSPKRDSDWCADILEVTYGGRTRDVRIAVLPLEPARCFQRSSLTSWV